MRAAIDILSPGILRREDAEALWRLYAPDHDVSRALFDERLRGFERLAVFRERRGGRVVGFTGVRIREMDVSGRRYGTLYFGQSYIEEAFRGRQLIQRTVTWLMLTLRARSPAMPWYFWSDALSYKPYLIMARNLDFFYPSPARATPCEVKELLDRLGSIYYGDAYDPAFGTVNKAERRLRAHVAPIRERELGDPFIRFYAERNPGHDRGHGLLITCPMTFENLASYLRRVARRAITGRR